MLMSNSDRPAKLHYMANGFRVLTPGDHVVCAASGVRIPIEELRYWDVGRQHPYATAQIATEVMAPR
jgi:hypothetical protein